MLDDHLLAAVRGHVLQVETLSDLTAGHFEAVTNVARAFDGCVVGLGVAEAADGEIVAVNGAVWRVPADGVPQTAPRELGLPFAVAARGGRSHTRAVPDGTGFVGLTAEIDEALAAAGDPAARVAAVRIEGTFRDVLLRSEPRQEPPYRLLSDVLDHEVRFPFAEWTGTLAGFRFPDRTDGVAIPGLHLHAISADRTSGGHCHHATVSAARLTVWVDDVTFVSA